VSRAISTLLAVSFLLGAALPVAADQPEPPTTPAAGDVVPGEVVVKWRDAGLGTDAARARGLTVLRELDIPGKGMPALLSTQGRPVDDVLAELRADPAVAYAEPNYAVHLVEEPSVQGVSVNDPKSSGQYSLDQMRVRDAWSLSTGGPGVVAVLDTGVQANHPDLVGRVLPGHDFVNNDTNAADDNGHGTWVSGIVAANANDGYGITGISWSDKILPLKIMTREGSGDTADLTSGIIWAADHEATVINMSVGGFPYAQHVQDAVNYAWNKGIVLVGAAGNNAREESFYPASFTNVISVSATQVNDEFASWSSYGANVDVSAPGASVQTTNCTVCTYADHNTWGDHTYISGTSFATPNVAGTIALIRARFPADSPARVTSRLIASVDDRGYAGFDKRYGRGRVNAYRALGGVTSAPAASTGDAYEPNNSVGAARLVPLVGTIGPSVYPAGDVDLFAVDVARAGRLDVRVTGVIDIRDYPWNRSALPVDPIVEILSSTGAVLTRVDAQGMSGTEFASATVTGPTRLLLRVVNWYANGSTTPYSISTTFVDEVPPRILNLVPAPNAVMVPTRSVVGFFFSEPVTGVDASSVTLRTWSGTPIPATVTYDVATRSARVVPASPLPSGKAIVLGLSDAIRDEVGQTLVWSSYRFSTMPGITYLPSRRVTFAPGLHVGHRVGAAGALLGLRFRTLSTSSGAATPQRATLPNLPGAWLYIENGLWAGTWIQEGPGARIAGTAEERALAAGTRLTLLGGTHVGRLYDDGGQVIASLSALLWRTSGATVDRVAVINGARQYHVTNGIWTGYWIAESSRAFRAGFADRIELDPARRIQIGAGTHVGLALDADGRTTGSVTARLAGTSGVPISAWAVVAGRSRVLVAGGIWAGTWLPAGDVLAYER